MTDDELKYELFRLKTRSKINRKEILWKLLSFYILSVIISLELFFVEYNDLTLKDLIITNIIIMMLFLVIFILFCTLNYIKFVIISNRIENNYYGGTMIYLDKNIAVITQNVEAPVAVDDILDTIALDTAYKVHVIAYSANGAINKDNENTLYDLLNLLSECNTYNRPIYVHISKYCILDSKKFTSIADNITYLKEKKTHLYRFGNIVLKKCNKKYYKRISLDSIK